ncbi:NapC/NirT family cytochrome c [Nitrosococcus oceani]|uniref:NapC/NirT cytochrome c-like protein n=2 Tax=Nitrosococcus oceani TaxID=1229 RepID=Q3JCN9_NITOC|nr:NapC/NirT family cytochrome c [Nitrosococcus oceani]KFI20180.1 cytochrome C [Nitrosococcus oceani C-27]ABA57407.1 NapC/NirT cytochrome c-like protein [Nitrosococcus oceani ATCC 19707]EDZ67663.1 NapC/NirT cytochrome c family, N-terminal domain [Nitrosococcus oceani AFC27]KFI23482.1 cytochrome C [Nitrosococcus oceani]GEM21558.1 cytochrome c [Nitrosococcus oceani]
MLSKLKQWWQAIVEYFKVHWRPVAVGAGGLFALIVIVFGGEAALSTTTFCTSCHSMSYPYEELQESAHYGRFGLQPQCKDCHIPQGLGNFHKAVYTHVVDGARELYLELVNDYSTLEKFNERRQEMAHHARMNLKGWDSVTCRDCHQDPQPAAKSGQRAHKKLDDGWTCIDCHQNLVHAPVEHTDLDASERRGEMVIMDEIDWTDRNPLAGVETRSIRN